MYLYLIKSKQLRKYNQNWVDWRNFIAHINKLGASNPKQTGKKELMRQIYTLLVAIGLLFSCDNTEKNNASLEKKTIITTNKKERLIEELNRLQTVFASNDEEKIADILSFPISNETIGIYIDDNSFNEQLKKNDNKVTRTMFINSFREISESLQINQINLLFKKTNLNELLKQDTIENKVIFQTEPCYHFYGVKVEKDLVILTVGTASNDDYKSKSENEDEIPANSSEFCESVLWWTFQFDGKKLNFKNISGAG